MTSLKSKSAAADHPFFDHPHRTILSLSLPALLSLLPEPLTGLVDTAFIARLGVVPLAALGIATTALISLFWVFNFLGIGAQTEVAQATGQRNPGRAARMTSLALLLSLLFGVVLIIGLWPFLNTIAQLLGAAGPVERDAVIYMKIRLWGGPAVLLLLTAFGVLRGLQDMRTPLWVALGLNVLNIVLDALMIFGFAGFTSTGLLAIPAMGVAGAAYASIIAQWLGALWAAGIVIRRLGWTWQFQWQEMTHLFKAGGDLFIRTGLLNFFVLFSTRLANQMGPESGAAYQAIRQVWLFLAISMDALALTAQSLIGYFIGAGQISQAKQVAWWCALWGIGLGVIAGLGMWLGQGAVASLLVPVEALAIFGPAWRVAALSQPINVLAFVTDGIHWGTGDYAFLRNAMLAATGIGCLGLLLFTQLADSLVWLWVVIGLWGMARAGFGVARIWPGWGDSPFKRADRYEAVDQSP